MIAGFTFMDLRTAIYGPIEVAGGGQAGLVFLTALREKSGTESPARALDYVLALCRSFGFRTKNANYRYGYAEIGEGGADRHPRPPRYRPRGWGLSCSPFAGTLADGQLYGRGVEDDKGPAIACVYAMRGLLTINAGQLAVEEGEVRVYFDIRYPVTASGETVLARMRAAAAPYGLRVWKRHEMRPVYMDKNSRVIRSLLAAYREQTGDMGEPLVVGGGTYARAMKNIVAFGPGRPGRASTEHEADEHLPVEELLRLREIYRAALEKLLD